MNLQTDPHAHLRAAFDAGCRIQAWHLNDGATTSNDGRWDTLTPPDGREPEFGCEPHLYRVHPDDVHMAPGIDAAELSTLARSAIPFLEEVGNEFDDDGQNEPLELSRKIRDAAGAE